MTARVPILAATNCAPVRGEPVITCVRPCHVHGRVLAKFRAVSIGGRRRFHEQVRMDHGSPNRTLAEFGLPKGVYPIGRLDADSEGLLLLSDEAALNQRLLHPSRGHTRLYWAQVERIPDADALATLERGLVVQGHETLPCRAWLLDPQPEMAPRVPPIRFRKRVADCWIALELVEGKNRQVRRMTAAIGHPTLRLIRVRIGNFELGTLPAGEWRGLDSKERLAVLTS